MKIHLSPVMRLTVWYVLIIMILSLMFSTIIYQITIRHIQETLPTRPLFFQGLGSNFLPNLDDRWSSIIESRYEQVAARLRWSLVILNGVVLVGSSLASYFLAKRTLRPIEEALDDQRKFTADASHELRTPLTAMKTEIEVALHGDGKSHIGILKSNLEEIKKLENLSASLLTLARHEDERRHTPLVPIGLASVAESVMKRVGPLAEAKTLNIVQHGLSGELMGDHGSLVDLFVILIDNAIKYSPPKSTVEFRAVAARRHVVVKVADHGQGIEAADLPHVFDRFYRADESRSKKSQDGYGLGLSIAKHIVERHHGTIALASKLGEGTTVTVTLSAWRGARGQSVTGATANMLGPENVNQRS
ncbi:MAG: HAMP domain-containing histidine kinase [Candidatus Kerfeldbacteria bacterium]|nr:HAMP domain-containing histidine kinase [Candidatus Kerfeldbacteria bacterium]